MSVSVKIRTKDVPEPDAILRRVADKGTEIVATSNEYPSLKFGFLNKALSGIEVNEEEGGLGGASSLILDQGRLSVVCQSHRCYNAADWCQSIP